MKFTFVVGVLILVSVLAAQASPGKIKFSDYAQNADGSPLKMRYSDADVYCADQEQRLPTARELVSLGREFGAKGIWQDNRPSYCFRPPSHSPVPPPEECRIPHDVEEVSGYDNGVKELFFYDRQGYKIPEKFKPLLEVVHAGYFWSSTMAYQQPDDPEFRAYIFTVDAGAIRDDRFGEGRNLYSVICVKEKN